MASNKDWDIIHRSQLSSLLAVKKNPDMLDYEINRLKDIMDPEEFERIKAKHDAE